MWNKLENVHSVDRGSVKMSHDFIEMCDVNMMLNSKSELDYVLV
jgi:hypothetical protein